MSAEEPLVRVAGLEKYFWEKDSILDRLVGEEPTAVRAVDGVSFDIYEGETLGLVGESGCGKSTTGETLLRLQEPTDGSAEFEGRNVYEMEDAALNAFRREAQVVFQDPFSSLDPRMTIGQIVRQPLDIHGWPWTNPTVEPVAAVTTDGIGREEVSVVVDDDVDKVVAVEDGVATVPVAVRTGRDDRSPAEAHVDEDGGITAEVPDGLTVEVDRNEGGVVVRVSVGHSETVLRRKRVQNLLERVGLSADQLERYPHEFSGGQRQRIGIARALALEPEFLVLDEPTSALDVSVQAQVLNLLDDLQDEFDLTYLLISHDLSVIRHVCDRVAVMYLGEIVEVGPSAEIFEEPKHPYTQALLESVPRASTEEKDRDRETLAGDVPSPRNPPSGCRFRTRCPMVIPPDDLEIDQETYRAIMSLRERIENRAVSLESTADDGVEIADDAGDDRDTAVEALKSRLLEVELPPRHDDVVTEALTAVVAEDWEGGAARLREAYESVCERENPALGEGAHPVGCHLSDRDAEPDVPPASRSELP